MRIATSPSFSKWLLSVNSYPLNELRATRHGITCKYVIFEGQYADARFANNQFHCARPMEFAWHIVEKMISQGGCKPLPPDMTGIMDYMYELGLQKSPKWYSTVLSTLYEMLEETQPCERKDIFIECIYGLVREMIMDSSYDFDSNEGQILMDAWHGYCCHWYDYNNKFSFQVLVSMSQSFVDDCIEDLDNLGFLQPHNAVHCGNFM
ncbi:expressed unknown protein [Seminavis robusta]|uniref:Uncharacterized protein n=1 Tax=Seminavis robusta TaxID=568900 RepID=A0A9N8DYM2_9STRA|nr:expressed unknown protein [Seminavis robusta]|eukprot:Sro479_g151231.1  (207) ;mRNA; r:45335-45955